MLIYNNVQTRLPVVILEIPFRNQSTSWRSGMRVSVAHVSNQSCSSSVESKYSASSQIDTLVSGQLLLQPPSENPVFLHSYTNSAFLHSRKRPVTVTKILSVSRAYPLTRASIVSLIFNHLLLLKWRPRKKLDVRDCDKTICVNSVPWVLEISKSVKCCQKKQTFRVYNPSSVWEKPLYSTRQYHRHHKNDRSM